MQWRIRDWLWATALFAITCSNAVTAYRLSRAEWRMIGLDNYRDFRDAEIEEAIRALRLTDNKLEGDVVTLRRAWDAKEK